MNIDKLKGQIPDSVLSQIPDTMTKFNINTPLRLAHFLAQCSHESANFTAVRENLNYSADSLKKVFPKYFPGTLSEQYQRNPEKIASKVYGGRMGNGDETTKEGFKFRGRGFIQLTGKDNYKSFGQAINENLIENPDLVATKFPLLSAAWFFSKNGINTIADKGPTDEVIKEVTKRVNGGTIGLEDRVSKFKKFFNLLK
jgi:putative chitinase